MTGGSVANDTSVPTGNNMFTISPSSVLVNTSTEYSGNVFSVNGNSYVNGKITVGNGFTVSSGAVSFPAGSISPSAISGGVSGSIAGINSAGNVAINQTSGNPLYALDISGNVNISGNLLFHASSSISQFKVLSNGLIGYFTGVVGEGAGYTGFNWYADPWGNIVLSNELYFYNNTYSLSNYIHMALNAGGQFYIYTQDNAGVYLNVGAINWSSSSDQRIKRDIVDVEPSLEKLMKINPVYYNYKKDSPDTKPRVGFIAQNVQPQFPVAVSKGSYNEEIQDNVLGLAPTELIPYMVKSIQEQQKQIDDQQTQIQEQQKQIDDLKSMVNQLMSLLKV